MVHTAPPSRGRRRIELVIGAILAVVGIAVAAIAVAALSHPKGRQAAKATGVSSSSSSSSSTSASTKPSVTASKTAPSKTKSAPSTKPSQRAARPAVLVLNNSNTAGLADTAVGRFRAGGWTASNGGNFSGDILSTAAYYDPSISGARTAAEALQAQFPAIDRVV
jgi:hypothetical protein